MMRFTQRGGWLAIAILLAQMPQPAVRAQVASLTAARSPAQPAAGPGGATLSHGGVIKRRYGTGAGEYWLYEPDAPKPTTATLVIFLHGWGATNPVVYGAWIDHLVRRGSVVIYPRFQADNRTPLRDFTPNALAAIHAALTRLWQEPGHVRPDLNKVAVVGHSVGGLLAANIAADAALSQLPAVRAVMAVQPGRTWNPGPLMNVPLADMSLIPAGTLLLTVVGDADVAAHDTDARRIFSESTRLRPGDKNYIIMNSDPHGMPALRASHFAPVAPDAAFSSGEALDFARGDYGAIAARAERERQAMARASARGSRAGQRAQQRVEQRMQARADAQAANRAGEPAGLSVLAEADPAMFEATGMDATPRPGVDALDYNGLWKLFDALGDAAFYSTNRAYALGDTPQQRNLGQWSDGAVVKELTVITTPARLPH